MPQSLLKIITKWLRLAYLRGEQQYLPKKAYKRSTKRSTKACVSGIEINGAYMANNLTTSTLITEYVISNLDTLARQLHKSQNVRGLVYLTISYRYTDYCLINLKAK